MYSIAEVRNHIARLPNMAALDVKDYAEEEGLADSLVSAIGRDLKPTQLRKIFHYVKDLQREYQDNPQVKFDRTKVAILMPSMAYAVGRKLIPADFYELMKTIFGSQKCQTREDFNSAANFLEAVMAYHKYRENRGRQF